MKAETIKGIDHINKNCTSSDRILLINPPVVETRYQWIRWNQPLDLLKLGDFLRKEVNCEVKLFDFMLPNGGRVLRTTNKPDANIIVDGYSYSLWRYGEGKEKFRGWLNRLRSKWCPTQVWVTSLTSYWWIGISDTINLIKSVVPEAQVVLLGQYPILEAEHAKHNSFAHLLVTESINTANYSADFSLYTDHKPDFCAMDVHDSTWHQEVIDKYKNGISDFVFFNDNILEEPDHLLSKLRSLSKQALGRSQRRLKFHAICGLYPELFSEEVAKELRHGGFVELHFEHNPDHVDINLDTHIKARQVYHRAGFSLNPDALSSFLFIGLPTDKLELVMRNMLNLFEIWGSVILKPYTPTPGSQVYQRYKHLFEIEEIQRLSPHFFPFSQVNGISHEDYDELYTLAAALNQKVRNRSFNSFPGTLSYEMIRTSLEREVWKLGNEESPAN